MLRSLSRTLPKIAGLHLSRNNVSGLTVRQLLAVITAQTPAASNRLLHVTSSSCIQSQEDIDRSLYRMDQEIRRTGRIARQEIDEILQDFRDMKKATSNQSLMILRCCGELVPSETPETRTKLVQEVWKTMENLSVPIDISHYNALLRVYLENEYKFNPTDILQELANKGIEPNRVTYQRLIARYCQEGDIDGASTILQHMKEKQLPINEHVFNALVNGHAMADDMESAEGIIAVMRQAGLEPNDDTYVTLMNGYARKGDLDNIKRIAQDCSDKEVHLIDRDFMNVIYTLTANGHKHLVDSVVPLLKKQSGFNQDATNVIFRLINIGELDTAYKLLKEMVPIVRNEEVVPSGNFFITQLVKNSPPEKVVQYCKMMADEGVNKHALSKACDVALQLKQFDKASALLEAYKELGAPIRQHYFWPFFAGSRDEKDIFDGLKTMNFLELSPSNETLRDYVIPALFKHAKGSLPEAVLKKLSSYTGIPLTVLVPAAMQHLINEHHIDQAISFATKYRLRFSNPILRRALVDMYFRERNAAAFVQIVGSSSLDGDDNARESLGQMIMEILERSKSKGPFVLPILQEMLKYGIGLSNSGAELIQNSLGDELTPELANIFEQLTASDLTAKVDLFTPTTARRSQANTFEDKTVADLEAELKEAIQSNRPTRSIKKALLFLYSRQRTVDKASAIHQELAAEGFVFPTGLQALMLDMYSECNKLEEAKAVYKSLKVGLDFPIDDVKILHYAGVLAVNGEKEECLEFLKTVLRDETRKPFGGHQQAAAWKVLNSVADQGDVDTTKRIFDCLKDRHLIVVNNVTLGPVVRAYLVKDDIEGALAEFENCVKEYHVTPLKQQLFCRFIKAEDADRLQKMIDLSTNLHGEVNTMYDLVFCFIECGKLRQAKRILETPGLRARNDKLEFTCQKYLEENRVGDLENLIQITKDVMHVDRSALYFYLLQAYCKMNDPDKALSIWTSLQEENVQPSSELLIFLADFLRKNDKPVPFVVPELEAIQSEENAGKPVKSQAVDAPETTTTTASITSPQIKKFRQSIESNQIDIALQIKQRLENNSGGEKLNFDDLSSLVDKMSRAERLGEATRLAEEMLEKGSHPFPRVLRFLLGRLASAGEVDTLNRFELTLTPELKRQTMFNTRLCIAYTNANKGREYFEKYVKSAIDSADKDSLLNVPLSGATYILTRHEELLGQFEEYAKKAEEKGSMNLQNSLWSYHLIKKNFEKARELWSKLKNEPRVMFRSVMVESKIRQDEEIARELVKHISSADNFSRAAIGSAHTCVIDILCDKGKSEEALAYLQTALQKTKIEDYRTDSLTNLKQSLEKAGKTFPYAIPTRSQKRGRKQADDSDSD